MCVCVCFFRVFCSVFCCFFSAAPPLRAAPAVVVYVVSEVALPVVGQKVHLSPSFTPDQTPLVAFSSSVPATVVDVAAVTVGCGCAAIFFPACHTTNKRASSIYHDKHPFITAHQHIRDLAKALSVRVT